MDYQGIAIFVGSVTGFLTVVLGFVLQVLILMRQTKQIADLGHVKELVNGQSEKLNKAIQTVAFVEGEPVNPLARELEKLCGFNQVLAEEVRHLKAELARMGGR